MFQFRYFGSFDHFGSFCTETSLQKHKKPNNFGRIRIILAKNQIFTETYFGVSVKNPFRSSTRCLSGESSVDENHGGSGQRKDSNANSDVTSEPNGIGLHSTSSETHAANHVI